MKSHLSSLVKCILSRLVKLRNYKKDIVFHKKSFVDSKCYFEGHNAIGMNTKLTNCSLGVGTYVGKNNEFTSIKIGKFCSIGSFIINTTGRHPAAVFVTTHPAFFSNGKAAGFTFTKDNKFDQFHYASHDYLVSIGNDVWIGDRVTILDGIKIGDGAIIGSNSVVTKDIDPYTINVGIPAKPIKMRFKSEEIDFLLRFQWWNKDWEWIKHHSDDFENINDFLLRNK